MPRISSTSTKQTVGGPYSSSPPRRLATPSGRWILKTQAMQRYKLAASDLESIFPVEYFHNPRGGGSMVVKYNEIDVMALDARLNPPHSTDVSASVSLPLELATPRGQSILRTQAIKQFGLKAVQLDRIKPISIQENPHRAGGPPMRYYNLCDVKALVDKIREAADAPSTLSREEPCSSG
ncbi:hypothetical protein BV22DRAFT_1190516 [Leucogyrophana mollusca]|uniref:Uncharacterized protein n=1 Tax=Leucogyrophana mollusca TaxID=85980 RepID=A0ACB8C1V5_9AGAM|nr:hypothetical protein BV22DRAFT_1190516 [Leucogyrophana mollusca]